MTATQTPRSVAGDIRTEITDAIRYVAQHTGRSAQAALGPSEVGHPCDRRIAYHEAGTVPVVNPGDPLAAFLGTGGHTQLEHAFQVYEGQEPPAAGTYVPGQDTSELVAPYRDNPRYLTEHRVAANAWLSGTTDLYDLLLNAVIDFKWVGAWSLAKYRRHGPPRKYRVQGHTYGLGWQNAGYEPEHVAIAFLPRETSARHNVRCSLDYVWVWSEPYEASVALEAIERVERIRADVAEMDMAAMPELWEVFPTTPGDCGLCPFHNPLAEHLGQGCPGV